MHPPSLVTSLVERASGEAQRLGHQLGDWVKDSLTSALAECLNCGLYAVVETSAFLYEPDIHGSAVRVRCEGKGTQPYWQRSTAHADPVDFRFDLDGASRGAAA